jgi:AraC family transcriptional regulator
MPRQLSEGHFFGETVRRRETGDVILTETVYPPRTRIPRHSHAAAYLCYVRSGGYTETYDSKTRACGPRTVAFHPGGEEHAEEFGDRPAHSFNIELPPAFLSRHCECLPLLDGQAEFRGEPLAGLAARLYREFLESADGLTLECLLSELLAQGLGQLRGEVRAGVPRWLERARESLHDRFRDRIRLADLARDAGVHPIYLASAFRRHYRASVGEYARRLRVEFAARELEQPGLTLADIAAAAGFADQAHLTRVFKEYTGLTPGEYRAQRQ